MKAGLSLFAVLALAWLALWIFNLGVLVYSGDTIVPKTRECRYFIGVSVLKRIEPLADRCPLVRGIGS
jgi:hypothetical protein